jgi:hypothetical protein
VLAPWFLLDPIDPVGISHHGWSHRCAGSAASARASPIKVVLFAFEAGGALSLHLSSNYRSLVGFSEKFLQFFCAVWVKNSLCVTSGVLNFP